jgi:hypothetical protein
MQELKQNKLTTRIPKSMMTPVTFDGRKIAGDDSGDLEKVAINMELLKLLGITGGLGAAGYGLARGIGAFMEKRPDTLRGLSMGMDNAISSVGKQTVKALSKNKPLTAFTSNTMTAAGKIADKLNPSRDRLRSNWDTLTGDPSKRETLKNLGIYVGTIAGTSIAEDYITDRLLNEFKQNKPAVANPEVQITVGDGDDGAVTFGSRPQGRMSRPGDVGRLNRFERPGRFDRPRRFDSPGRPRNFGAPQGFSRPPRLPRNDFGESRPPRSPRSDYRPRETFAFSNYLDGLEKEAISPDTKRLIIERVIKPAALTGTFMVTLGGISRLLGRNLYGGLEKVRTDDQVSDRGRIMIDIPTQEIGDPQRALVKKANAVDAAVKVIEKSRLDKLKDKLDAKIVNGPKFVRKLDDLLAQQEEVKYRGKTGLAHWAVEEVPFKAVEGLAYASPMAAIAIATGRNAKKAFEPIITDPNVAVPDGITRIVIEEHPENGKEEKKTQS